MTIIPQSSLAYFIENSEQVFVNKISLKPLSFLRFPLLMK